MERLRFFRLLAGLALLGLLVSLALFAAGQRTFEVLVNGQPRQVTARAWTSGQVLAAAGLAVTEHDRVEPAPAAWLGGQTRVQLEQARLVVVRDGEQTHSFWSVERLPANWLAQLGISLAAGDVLLENGRPISPTTALPHPAPPRQIYSLEVRRTQLFDIEEDDGQRAAASAAALVGQGLWEQGIALQQADQSQPALETRLSAGEVVRLRRAQWLRVLADGREARLLSTAATVGQALAGLGISLQGLDYSRPDEYAGLPADGIVEVVRVREEVLVEQTPLAFETEYQAAPDLALDQQTLTQPGIYGLTARRVRVRYENGLETGRSVEAEWVAVAPVQRVIGYGTKIVPLTVDTPDGTFTYWRAMQVYAVSYNPRSGGGSRTAIGSEVKKGVVAVDPRVIPLYTRMYVPGYGEAMAADTGGGVKGRMIDLAYSNEDYVGWSRNVTIYLLWPPPENIVWILP